MSLYEAVERARREHEQQLLADYRLNPNNLSYMTRLIWFYRPTYHLLILVSPLIFPRLRPPKLYLPIDLLRRLRKFL